MLAAHAGTVEHACALVDDAVITIERSDMATFIADMHATRADVYRRAGREAEAHRSLEAALARCRARDDRADVARHARAVRR